jgi:hypothetical protein
MLNIDIPNNTYGAASFDAAKAQQKPPPPSRALG